MVRSLRSRTKEFSSYKRGVGRSLSPAVTCDPSKKGMTRPAREYRKGSNAQPGGRLQRDARGESRTLTPLPAPDFESALYP